MDLRILTQPQQGASHRDLLEVARTAAGSGFTGFFRADHVLKLGPMTGLPGPSDSIASLAALAAQVPHIKVGTLMAAATFRHPAMLAIAIATIDDISGGRVELGLRAGWFAEEHTAYGLPFGQSTGERFDRLTEQLEVITGLWATPSGSTFSYAGRHYRLEQAPGLPKPMQRNSHGTRTVPIIIGGLGPKRTPHLAARFANEFNVGFATRDVARRQLQRLRHACEEIGRDPSTITQSAAHTIVCGTTPDRVSVRAAAIGRTVETMRTSGSLVGSPAQIVDELEAWRELGFSRFYLQILDLTDLEHILLIGAEVAAEFL